MTPDKMIWASEQPARRNLVVVGGGFAGCALARSLARDLPEGVRLLLLSEESYTTFNPLLAEVIGASIFPEHVVAPLRQVVRPSDRTQFVMGRVEAIDLAAGSLACHTLAGPITLAFDQLVLAVGNRARTDFLPGLAEHALPIKTVGDALEIRNVVLRRLAQIELESDVAVRAELGHFVIVGGGFSGVEVAGELADFLRSVRTYYPRVRLEELTVSVVQNQDRLLPELPPSLGEAARRSLERRGVKCLLKTGAAEATAHGLALSTGERLRARTLIASAGNRPQGLVERLDLELSRGRILVNPDFSVPGFDGLWAIGDCASVVNSWDEQPCPPTAQFAVRQGAHVADNLRAVLASQPTRPFRYRPRGQLATVGRLSGVAAVFGYRLSGLLAWLLWRAFYLSQMPTAGRKLRLWAEWTWAMLFSADITHFRFGRSMADD